MTAPEPITFEAVLRGGPSGFDGNSYPWPDMPPGEVYVYDLDRRLLRAQFGTPTVDQLDPTVSVPVRKHVFVIEKVRAMYRYVGEVTEPEPDPEVPE